MNIRYAANKQTGMVHKFEVEKFNRRYIARFSNCGQFLRDKGSRTYENINDLWKPGMRLCKRCFTRIEIAKKGG